MSGSQVLFQILVVLSVFAIGMLFTFITLAGVEWAKCWRRRRDGTKQGKN